MVVIVTHVVHRQNFGPIVAREDYQRVVGNTQFLQRPQQLSDDKVENAEELVKVGDPIEVKVLRVDTEERKIGLSKKQVSGVAEE